MSEDKKKIVYFGIPWAEVILILFDPAISAMSGGVVPCWEPLMLV